MPDWNPDDFEPIGGQGGTATAAPVAWNPDDFEAVPDLSKVQMDPYQRATVAQGGIKPETGMEAGTDFTASLANTAPVKAEIAALKWAVPEAGKTIGRAGNILEAPFLDVGQYLGKKFEGVPGKDIPQGENFKAAYSDQPMPGMETIKESSPALRIPATAGLGMVGSIPKLAATAVSPEFSPVIWGLTPEGGFDPKQAAIAAVLPGIGKYAGDITQALAEKMGVGNDTALAAFNKAGGIGSAAGLITADQAREISNLPPEKRKDAWIEAFANAGTILLGGMGGGEGKAEGKFQVEPRELQNRAVPDIRLTEDEALNPGARKGFRASLRNTI